MAKPTAAPPRLSGQSTVQKVLHGEAPQSPAASSDVRRDAFEGHEDAEEDVRDGDVGQSEDDRGLGEREVLGHRVDRSTPTRMPFSPRMIFQAKMRIR